MNCPACGKQIPVPTCPACGAGSAPGDETRTSEWSDYDQSLSDQDQTRSDQDQAGSERDQQSSDDDQRAADEDLAAGGDPMLHRRSLLAREQSSRGRGTTSSVRDETAEGRLSAAAERDRIAALRDQQAEARDAVAHLHDVQDDMYGGPADVAVRAARNRARAAADRSQAAADRVRAAADRASAAADRAAAHQRRAEAAHELRLASTDELTGAWAREAGLAAVARELQRAHRTGARLVLAFVDVDDLKKVNDTQGHLAGDALLRVVGRILRAHVRTYDLIVRYGGDEFVCAMSHLDLIEATTRLEQVADALSATAGHSIAFGLAAATPSDTLDAVIARADANLLEAKRAKKHAD